MEGPNFKHGGMLARSLRLPKRKCDWRQAGATKGSYAWQAVVPGIPNIVPGYGGIRKPREGGNKNREAGWVAGRSKRAEPDATHESRSVGNIGRWVSLLKRWMLGSRPFFLAPRRFESVKGTGLMGAVRPETPHRSPRQAFGGTWNARPLQLGQRGLARPVRGGQIFVGMEANVLFGKALGLGMGGKWSRRLYLPFLCGCSGGASGPFRISQ